jgi:hypothetical protein
MAQERAAMRNRRRIKVRRARTRVLALMVLLVTGGVGLVAFGLGQVRGSTAGRYIDPSLQPNDPGYAAFVTPTPTLLVVHKGADGQLSGVAVLSLQAGDQGGSVMVLPTGTRGFFGQTPQTLAQAFATQGIDSVSSLVEQVLKADMQEVVEVDDARWATLVEPVGGVEVQLDAPVGNWPEGHVTLTPADIGPFLSALSAGRSELTRTDRQELFWRGWLDKVTAAGGQNAIGGESGSGLGRFVQGIAIGSDVSSIPVAAVPGLPEQYAPDDALLGEEIARSIPYPQSPGPGMRVRVRLLNGTADTGLTARAAEKLVAAGAEITISGNAASFAEPSTKVLYGAQETLELATWYQTVLGIGVIEQDTASQDAPVDESEGIDLTVILGADAPAVFRR